MSVTAHFISPIHPQAVIVSLAGYLAGISTQRDGTLRWTVDQGVEMGRPSRLELEADKTAALDSLPLAITGAASVGNAHAFSENLKIGFVRGRLVRDVRVS